MRIEINYGPYDRLFAYRRFVGNGPDQKPLGAGFYPEDLSREEYLKYLKDHSEDKDLFENLYSVIYRTPDGLKAKFYHQIYESEILQITPQLKRAAEITKNEISDKPANDRSTWGL